MNIIDSFLHSLDGTSTKVMIFLNFEYSKSIPDDDFSQFMNIFES